MSRVHSFAPLCGSRPRILILGSMPGRASLLAQQYYAHPRNAFWPIIESLFGIDRSLDYPARCALLVERGVAVWDVLKTCTRTSSLDSDIDPDSIVANDFASFLGRHGSIRHLYFNGAMAEQSYRRHVLPALGSASAAIPRQRLPSTSPANASYSFDRKLALWRVIRE
jgi:TDG/mug DNA glycosylase family protein